MTDQFPLVILKYILMGLEECWVYVCADFYSHWFVFVSVLIHVVLLPRHWKCVFLRGLSAFLHFLFLTGFTS